MTAHEHHCPNCKKVLVKGQGHYVPPSLGESGYYICNKPGELDLMQALKNALRPHSKHLLIIDECSEVPPDAFDKPAQGAK